MELQLNFFGLSSYNRQYHILPPKIPIRKPICAHSFQNKGPYSQETIYLVVGNKRRFGFKQLRKWSSGVDVTR